MILTRPNWLNFHSENLLPPSKTSADVSDVCYIRFIYAFLFLDQKFLVTPTSRCRSNRPGRLKNKSGDIHFILIQKVFYSLWKRLQKFATIKIFLSMNKTIFSWNRHWEFRRPHSWFVRIESLPHGVKYLLIEHHIYGREFYLKSQINGSKSVR